MSTQEPTPNAKPVNPSEQAALESRYPDITEENRVPMDIAQAKLAVPELPGWYLYWHLESNVPAAIMAGYQFVEDRELNINQLNVATSGRLSGNEDLGSHIRRMGGVNQMGQPEYHVLMKLKMEWHLKDQAKKDHRNAAIMQGIFSKERILDPEGSKVEPVDESNRYAKTALFGRSVMKRK